MSTRWVELFSRRRYLFYLVLLGPLTSEYVLAHWIGWEIGEWIGGIAFACALGSIIGTEITFVQIRLRPKDLLAGLMNEFSHTPQGRQVSRILRRIDRLLAGVDKEEFQRYAREGKEIARMLISDLREVAVFVHAFAERQRQLRKAYLSGERRER